MTSTAPDLSRARAEVLDVGFTVLRNAVDPQLLAAARRVISRAVGDALSAPPAPAASPGGSDAATRAANGLQLPHLMSDAAVLGLWSRSSLPQVIPALIGAPLEPVFGGQIALRFPGTGCIPGTFCPAPGILGPRGWHIDGLANALPQFRPGEVRNFTALVGVALSDVGPEPDNGALAVFPRGHRALNAHLNAVGLADLLQRGQAALPHASLALPRPHQVSLRAGDAVVAHYLLPHAVAANASVRVREVVYFRVSTAPGECRPLALLDMWSEWPALRALPAPSAPPLAPGDVAALAARTAGERAYDAHDWPAAGPAFARASDARPEDIDAAAKGGLAFTFAAAAVAASGGGSARTREVAAPGAPLLARACALAPAFAWAHAARARNWALQERWADALAAARDAAGVVDGCELAALDPAQPWQAQLLLDGLAAADTAAVALGQPQVALQLRAAAALRFPVAAATPASPGANGDIAAMPHAALWEVGIALVKREPKRAEDWARARAVFVRLAAEQPGVMWAHALAGICHTYSPGAGRADGARAVEYARAAAAADPASPVPPALACRAALVADGRGVAGLAALATALAAALLGSAPSAHAAAAVREAFARLCSRAPMPVYTVTHEHAWLLLDAARCVGTVAAGEERAALLQSYGTAFPGLATAARSL